MNMHHINSQTFNPEVLYVVDFWNEKENLRGLHHHDFIEISVILEGFVEYVFNDQKTTLGAGQVLLFNPGISHNEIHPENIQSHELHIGITNISFEGLRRNFFPNKSPLLDLGQHHGSFLNKAWQLTKEFNNHDYHYQLMGKGIIIEMLALILRGLEKKQTNQMSLPLSKKKKNKQTLVNHAIYYLENHHEEDIKLETLAEMLYISPTHLSKIFRENTGISPINYLIQIRLKRAKELLMYTDLSVKEIAETVGYQDASYFSKLFKKNYGLAPTRMQHNLNS